MADFELTVDYDDFNRLAVAVEQVRSSGILPVYSEFYKYFRRRLAERYDRVSEETEYSEAWKGTAQTVSGLIRGQDAKWGIDSGALYEDITQQVKIRDEGIEIDSDLPYADRIMELMEVKGPYAPYGILFMDEYDILELEDILFEYMARAFELRLK